VFPLGLDGEVNLGAPHAGGLALMIAAPGRVAAADIATALAAAGVEDARVDPIGSHAARYELNEARSGVFAPEN